MFVVVVAQHAAPLQARSLIRPLGLIQIEAGRESTNQNSFSSYLKLTIENRQLSQFGRFVSSTSPSSASIPSPGFSSCALLEPAEDPPPAPAPAAAPACPAAPAACDVLYSSSAILCSERSTFSVADRSRATPASLMAFFE